MEESHPPFPEDPQAPKHTHFPEDPLAPKPPAPGPPKDEDAKAKEKPEKKKSMLREWTEALVFAFIAVLLFRIFFFETFAIPSGSMDRTLLSGDYIVVNKLAYGPRLPITPLTIPFAHQKIAGGNKAYLDWIQLPYWRIPGYADIAHNDVLVFNFPSDDIFPLEGPPEKYPIDHRTHFVKRCMGLPGDTFLISAADVYVNGKKLPVPPGALFEYGIKTDSVIRDTLLLRKLGMAQESRQKDHWLYTVSLTHDEADSIRKRKDVRGVELVSAQPGAHEPDLFPNSDRFPWNLDHYGPLVIPRAGDSVRLSIDSLPLYKRIIVNYEENLLGVRNDTIFINGKPAKYYTFKMNYYFMLGDNRHDSFDSRVWGLVPEDHIVGRAAFILFSYDKQVEKTRWDRVFDVIR